MKFTKCFPQRTINELLDKSANVDRGRGTGFMSTRTQDRGNLFYILLGPHSENKARYIVNIMY